MRPVIVVKIYNFPDIISTVGVVQAVDMVYQLRTTASEVMGRYIVRECDDYVMGVLDEESDVSMAIDMAQAIMNTLCTGGCRVPLASSVGYGDLYETADGAFWGTEIYVAHNLASTAQQGEIVATPAAIHVYNNPQDDVGITLANNNTINSLEVGIDDEKAERGGQGATCHWDFQLGKFVCDRVGLSRNIYIAETDMNTVTGERNSREHEGIRMGSRQDNGCNIM